MINSVLCAKRFLVLLSIMSISSCGGGSGSPEQISNDSPSEAFVQLSTLLGDVSFNFALDDSDTVFTLQSRFETVEQRDSGLLQVLTTGRLFSRTGVGTEPVDGGDRVIDCAFNEAIALVLCGVSFIDGAAGYFAFNPLVNERSTGSFQFCTAEEESDNCLNNLLLASDGSVIVVKETSSVITFASRSRHGDSSVAFDVTADLFMMYLKQGVRNASGVQTKSKPVIDTMRELSISRKQITNHWAAW